MKKKGEKGFTLVEILIVIAIIGILFSVVLVSSKGALDKAREARTLNETRSLALSLEFFLEDNDYIYPCDVDRGFPSGLEEYLSTGINIWPEPPWPNSEYDWDYWSNIPDGCSGNLSHAPFEKVYQLSVRFCPLNQPGNCIFPEEDWAIGFDYHSSAYWCIKGPCRSHGGRPYNHPGCCLGGNCPTDQPMCK